MVSTCTDRGIALWWRSGWPLASASQPHSPLPGFEQTVPLVESPTPTATSASSMRTDRARGGASRARRTRTGDELRRHLHRQCRRHRPAAAHVQPEKRYVSSVVARRSVDRICGISGGLRQRAMGDALRRNPASTDHSLHPRLSPNLGAAHVVSGRRADTASSEDQRSHPR
jgi:hypothetical protein